MISNKMNMERVMKNLEKVDLMRRSQKEIMIV